jgi:serine/threonine protein kinase
MLSSVPEILNKQDTKSVDLSNNAIDAVRKEDFANMINLGSLDLSRNNIVNFTSNVFDGLTTLYSLDLSYNDLKALHEFIFRDLTALVWLLLGGNDLVGFPLNIFSGLLEMKILQFAYNPNFNMSKLETEHFEDLDKMQIFQTISGGYGVMDCFSADDPNQIMPAAQPGVNDCNVGQGVCTPDQFPYDKVFVGCDCKAGWQGERCDEPRFFVPVTVPGQRHAPTLASSADQYLNLNIDLAPNKVEVETTFRFTAPVINTTATTVTDGTAANITYTLGDDAPDAFMISPKFGEVLGQFETVGDYSITVIVVDHAGIQIPLETVTFTVLPADTNTPAFGPNAKDCEHGVQVDVIRVDANFTCNCEDTIFYGDNCELERTCQPNESVVKGKCSEFVLNAATNRLANAQQGYTNPTKVTYFAVGGTYRFASLQINATSTVPSTGSVAELKYTIRGESEDGAAALPRGLFMKADSGDVLVEFDASDAAEQNHTAVIEVQDEGGAVVVLETLIFRVKYRDTDPNHPHFIANGPNGEGCTNGGVVEDVDEDQFDGRYSCNCDSIPFSGDNCEIATRCMPTQSFVNGACKTFRLDVGSTRVAAENVQYTDPIEMENTFYTVDETYRIAPLAVLDTTEYSNGGKNELTYEMLNPPDGFFLSPTTGEMVGSFAAFPDITETRFYTICLQAVDGGGAKQVVETMTMRVRYKDSDVPEYGPDKQACKNDTTLVDVIPFDEVFTCDTRVRDAIAAEKAKTAASDAAAAVAAEETAVAQAQANATQTAANIAAATALLDKIAAKEKTDSEAAAAAEASAAEKKMTHIGAGAAVGGIVVLFLLLIAAYKYRQHKLAMQPVDFQALLAQMVESGAIAPDAVQNHRRDSITAGTLLPREIPRSCITKSEKVGEGAFGEVFKGVLDETSHGGVPGYLVACKSVTDATGDGAADLLQEATIMAQVGVHLNLVSLIGVVTSGVPLLIIIALCEHGSLQSQLKKRALGDGKLVAATRGALPPKLDVDLAIEIAMGMNHLVEHNLVHRDLAARNVLLDSALVAKVADFGLSRAFSGESEYYKSTNGMMALRWTAPEAMTTLKFSVKTDVWAFGIVLLEIYQNGDTPLKGKFNAEVMAAVQSGYKSPKPPRCPPLMYDVMCSCWDLVPAKRPLFTELVATMKQDEFADLAPSEPAWANSRNTVAETRFDSTLNTTSQNEVADYRSASTNDYTSYTAQPAGGGAALARSASTRSTYYVADTSPEEEDAGSYLAQGDASVQAAARQASLAMYSNNPGSDVPMSNIAAFTLADIGKRCKSGKNEGFIRFIGLHAENGEPRVGVELDAPLGKNNGTVNEEKYFECTMLHGTLCKPDRVTVLAAPPVPSKGRSDYEAPPPHMSRTEGGMTSASIEDGESFYITGDVSAEYVNHTPVGVDEYMDVEDGSGSDSEMDV